MSIQNAMQSGISGLFANSKRMSYVGNNIANSQTVGYKRQFADMVSMTAGGPAADQTATTVRTVRRMDMATPGNMMNTGMATDLAVIGSGYFVVGMDTEGDMNTTGHRLSRAGNFRMNENGFLVNSAGHYLYGYEFDKDGNLGTIDRGGFRDLKAVNLGGVSMQGNMTTNIDFAANLPSQQTGHAEPPEPFVTSVEYYNALGEAERMLFTFEPNTNDDQWTLRVSDDQGTEYGYVTINFNDSGPDAGSVQNYVNPINTAPPGGNFSFAPGTGVLTLTIPNGDTPQEIEVDFGAPGSFDRLIQFAGDYTPEGVRRNGSAASELNRVEVTNDGVLWGVFEDGSKRALYEVPLANVVNEEGLMEEEGNSFSIGINAGTLSLQKSGGDNYIASGVLERSNVDLAKELTDLIEIQRAYSSNAKIVQTADEMLAETTNLKR